MKVRDKIVKYQDFNRVDCVTDDNAIEVNFREFCLAIKCLRRNIKKLKLKNSDKEIFLSNLNLVLEIEECTSGTELHLRVNNIE